MIYLRRKQWELEVSIRKYGKEVMGTGSQHQEVRYRSNGNWKSASGSTIHVSEQEAMGTVSQEVQYGISA
jgi:hypothetical protein